MWQGLVFAAVDAGNAIDFDAFVEGIDARLGEDRGLERYGHHQRVGYDVACNWKVYVDNYLEGYHVPHIHPGLNKLLDYRSYVTEAARLVLATSTARSSCLTKAGATASTATATRCITGCGPTPCSTSCPAACRPTGSSRAAWTAAAWSSTSITPWTNPARRARAATPTWPSATRCRSRTSTICEDVQRGLASGSYTPGRLNPLRENAVHHFHELLRAAYRGSEEPPAAT